MSPAQSAETPDVAQPLTPAPRTVLDASDISRALTRIAHEILERNRGADPVVLLGIPTRGVGAGRTPRRPDRGGRGAERADRVTRRDHVPRRPAASSQPAALEHTDIPAGGIDGKVVVLVDDVLFSGRTIRAALDALGDLGRPRAVQLAVLVDRGHRELPIRADYVGKNMPTSLVERVTVHLTEYDGRDAVLIADTTPAGGPGAMKRHLLPPPT